MRRLKTALSIRGDSYYCPLSFQLDTYWNCENACHHCYMRRLNRTWGDDLRPIDLEIFEKQIIDGLEKEPKNSLQHAIHQRKTIRFGNKSDPYQNAELKYGVSRKASFILLKNGFSFVLQTMFTENVEKDMDLFNIFKHKVSFMPIVSPGLDKDWELLEKKGTTRCTQRLKDAARWQKQGFNVGINGEPFIPGYHTEKDFEETLKLLKSLGLKSYNTYHLHFNDWVAKEFHSIGLDIEKIWEMNQDENWRPILKKLIDLSKKYDIILGCPDFVNSGSYQESTNTCCGLNVPNPCTFNIINWKKLHFQSYNNNRILKETWDNIGDLKTGRDLLRGTDDSFYGLKDIKTDDEKIEDDFLKEWE